MEEYNDDKQKTSKYNSAVAQLMRLDNLWQMCHTSSLTGNYSKWYYILNKIWVELSADLDEDDDRINEFANLIYEFNKTGEIFTQKIKGFNFEYDNLKASKQYAILMKIEMWLKRLQNELGKGTKWDDDDDEETE